MSPRLQAWAGATKLSALMNEGSSSRNVSSLQRLVKARQQVVERRRSAKA